MSLRIYDQLSKYYDELWGNISTGYVGLIEPLLSKRRLAFARILDLASGSGSLAVELGRKGHVVFGLDASPSMVDIARKKSILYDNVKFKVHDMTEFSFKTPFDLITCTIDSMNYLVEKGSLEKFVSNVSNALKRKGLFIFDVNTESMYQQNNNAIFTHGSNGSSFVQRLTYDETNRRATALFEFDKGQMEIHQQRPYDLAELKKAMGNARIKITHTFSNFSGTPYKSGDHRLICIAERK